MKGPSGTILILVMLSTLEASAQDWQNHKVDNWLSVSLPKDHTRVEKQSFISIGGRLNEDFLLVTRVDVFDSVSSGNGLYFQSFLETLDNRGAHTQSSSALHREWGTEYDVIYLSPDGVLTYSRQYQVEKWIYNITLITDSPDGDADLWKEILNSIKINF